MDGSGVRTVVSLYSAKLNFDYTFVFTLDYSQQMLYWINGSNSCYYTHHIGSANSDGSGKRILYSHYTYCVSKTIDFFGGAVYSYRPNHIYKTEVDSIPKLVSSIYTNNHGCFSTYTGMKVISRQRQLQGIHTRTNCIPIKRLCDTNHETCYRCESLCHQQWWLCSSLSSQL